MKTVATEKPFLVAARGGRPSRRPVWLMRQAGRFLPEYRAVRARLSFLELCRTPEAAAEVTLQPLRRFGMDAAILFTDLLVPLLAAGVGLSYDPAPTLEKRVATRADVDALRVTDPHDTMPYLLETVRLVRRALEPGQALIGFVGAPFTLAAYLVEGKGSKEWTRTRRLMHSDPELFGALLERAVDLVEPVAVAQVAAGCEAIQIFDSWAGVLSKEQWRRHCARPFARLVRAVRAAGATCIAFVNGASQHLESALATGADCLSIDWRLPIADARSAIPSDRGLQGNLDPAALFAPADELVALVRQVLSDAGPSGHVMNLGHGIVPETDPEQVRLLVETVRSHDR